MRVFLLGAEQPTNARLLAEAQAKHVGLSFWSLRRKLPKKGSWLVSERLPDADIYVASGGHQTSQLSVEEAREFLDLFTGFVDENKEAISLVTEMDAPQLTDGDRLRHRAEMHEMMGEQFAPVWQPCHGMPELESLAATYSRVAVRADDVKSNPGLAARLHPLHSVYGTRWHLLDGARLQDMATGRFDTCATVAWLSPMRFGETIVWDGTRMQRYQVKQRDQAMKRHRSTFARAGFDADAIMGGDHEEITRFTVWSFQQMEAFVSRRDPDDEERKELSASETRNEDRVVVELHPPHADNTQVPVRNEDRSPKRREGPRGVLPVLGFEAKTGLETDEDGNKVSVDRLLPVLDKGPIRQCDTCFVAANCPAFKPGHECAFSLPVEIKTKEQLSALLGAVVEMQAQRVMFMRFSEELNGGYADPNVSQEMDRLLRLVHQVKEIQEDSSTFKMHIEAKSGAGMLSALFGEQAKRVQELDRPYPADQIIDAIVEE